MKKKWLLVYLKAKKISPVIDRVARLAISARVSKEKDVCLILQLSSAYASTTGVPCDTAGATCKGKVDTLY